MSKHAFLIKKAAAAAALTGRLPCDLYGTRRQLHAFSEALYATREFDRVLGSCDDVSAVRDALAAKRSAAARFRCEYGVAWPA